MIKNLLDTHTFLWFIDGSDNLSPKALENIENENAQNFISIVSLWEIAIKLSLGKLEVNIPFKQIEDVVFKNNFQILPISFTDLLKLSELPFHHRDPFDRLLIAQCINNEMMFLSKDENVSKYNASIIW